MHKRMGDIAAMLDFMDEHEIKIDRADVDKIKCFLYKNTYFFKLISYRKNFQETNGKYKHLSFDTLIDMSNIDMRFRYILLHMCLDIEHVTKSALTNELVFTYKDDGYDFLNRYINDNPNSAALRQKLLKQVKRTNEKLYNKHKESLPFWVVMECCEFSVLESILTFYIKEYPDSALSEMKYEYINKEDQSNEIGNALSFVRNIRNKVAHNSVLLNEITSYSDNNIVLRRPHLLVNKLLSKTNLSRNSKTSRLKNATLYDITVTFAVYDYLVTSESMKNHRYQDLMDLIERTEKNKSLYKNNEELVATKKYFSSIVNSLTDVKK